MLKWMTLRELSGFRGKRGTVRPLRWRGEQDKRAQKREGSSETEGEGEGLPRGERATYLPCWPRGFRRECFSEDPLSGRIPGLRFEDTIKLVKLPWNTALDA